MTKTMLLALSALVMPGVAHAGTVGNAADERYNVDNASRQTFVLNQAFGTAGQRVSQYSFYALRAGTLTPLLFSRTVSGDESVFRVVGRGTAFTATAADAAYTVDFGLTTGSDVTTGATYFGFENADLGVVAWDYYGGGFEAGRFEHAGPEMADGPPGTDIFITEFSGSNAVGDRYTFNNDIVERDAQNGLAMRIYSINATSVPGAVPEPASWAMMIAGFGLAGAAMRRRRVRTTVRFA